VTAGTPPTCNPRCTIGPRSDLEAIVADRAQGLSLTAVALKHKASRSALARHERNCSPGKLTATDRPPRGSLLSRRVEDKAVQMVLAGCFDWIGAQAAGISARTFARYMERGAADDEAGLTRSPFRRFYLRIREARAAARARAEYHVNRDQPLAWLRYGPGRERPNEPGWTDNPEIVRGDAGQAFVLVLQGGGAPKVVPVIDTTAMPALPAVNDSPDEDEGTDGNQ
jgi:hypothetical protein